jgi:hypothetical protein
LGNKNRPYMSKARTNSKAIVFPALAKSEAFR